LLRLGGPIGGFILSSGAEYLLDQLDKQSFAPPTPAGFENVIIANLGYAPN
jgi:hypothetical protein